MILSCCDWSCYSISCRCNILHEKSSIGSFPTAFHGSSRQSEVPERRWAVKGASLFIAHANSVFGLVHTEIMSVTYIESMSEDINLQSLVI